MTEQPNTNRQAQLSAYVAIAGIGAGALLISTAAQTWANTSDTLKTGMATALPVTLVSICGFSAIALIAVSICIVAWTRRPATSGDIVQISQRPPMATRQIQQQRVYELPPPAAQPETIYTAWRGDLAHANERAALSAYRDTATYADEYREPELTPPAAPAPLPPAKLTVRLGADGDELTISRDAWLAFVALAKPTRDEWRRQLTANNGTAPNTDYSKCNRIAGAYSALNGRGEWVSNEAQQQLTAWVCPSPTPSE